MGKKWLATRIHQTVFAVLVSLFLLFFTLFMVSHDEVEQKNQAVQQEVAKENLSESAYRDWIRTDSLYFWISLFLLLIIGILQIRFMIRLNRSIRYVQAVANKIVGNAPPFLIPIPDQGFSEIVNPLIQLDNQLLELANQLILERQKMVKHLQSSNEGLGIFDAQGREVIVNSQFTRYVNLISDHKLARNEELFELIEFKQIANFIAAQTILTADQATHGYSIPLTKNERNYLVECVIFQDRSFKISIHDNTQEEKQALVKRQMTQNIAHELKTPVSSIRGYLETIVSNPTLSEEKKNLFIERCYAQSNRLTRLLRDISSLTRMEELSTMIEMERVNLFILMQTITQELTLELDQKQIKVHNLLSAAIYVKGNYSHLYSIFRNLTDNAIAYGGFEISIQVSCFKEDEKYYYLSFFDTGVGVDPIHLNRLFERFYRIDTGRSRKLGGTGLGLAIVKNAIQIHGGTIFAKQHPKGGLEFVFTLEKGGSF